MPESDSAVQGADPAHLADRLREGDAQALADVFDRNRPRLRRMIEVRIDPRLAGRIAPSDILQEAWLDAVRRLPDYASRPDMSPVVWLRSVVGQRLVDAHRQHFGPARFPEGGEVSLTDAQPASSHCLATQLIGNSTSPGDAAARTEVFNRLEQALNSLEPLDREVLALRHFEELSNDETAEALGLSKSASSKRYIRALGRLKSVLDQLSEFRNER